MVKIVEGDIFNSKEQVIVQQLNCVAVKPHGLSNEIAKRYTYGDVYSKRRAIGSRNWAINEDIANPGDISISKDPLTQGPIIIGIFGQYIYGKPGQYNYSIDKDNYVLREKWFKMGLDKLSEYLIDNNIQSVCFPYLIGCGLAGGNWSSYLSMIKNFSDNKPYNVVIYKL